MADSSDYKSVSFGLVEECLKSAGVDHSVIDIQQSPAESFTAQLTHLQVRFSDGTDINALMKVMQAPFFNDGRNEIHFYQQASRGGLVLPVPNFLGGLIDEANQRTALLIEEVTGDFLDYDWGRRDKPDKNNVIRLVSTLAKLHASTWNQEATWDRSRFCRELAEQASAAADLPTLLNRFIKRSEGLVSPRARASLGDFVPVFVDRFLAFLDTSPAMSVIHGDVHFGNLLVPQDQDQEIVMIDWANWAIDQPADDLAHAIVSQLPPDFSAANAREFISVYLNQLRGFGIDYSDEVFERDFRFAIARQLIRPVVLAELVPGIDDAVWQEMLVNIFAGVDQFDVWPLLEA